MKIVTLRGAAVTSSPHPPHGPHLLRPGILHPASVAAGKKVAVSSRPHPAHPARNTPSWTRTAVASGDFDGGLQVQRLCVSGWSARGERSK